MLTFAQLKTGMRARVFPAGEAQNLRAAHDKSVVDALVDVQRWVDCLQNNNTYLIPHCNTVYNCGLTSFDFPRAIIHKLSVIDKVNAETGLPDAAGEDDWCCEIPYTQVDACHMRNYLARSSQCGSCWPFSLFFAIPQALLGGKSNFPIPTDEGVAAGLPVLPLGYHYPQTSTDVTSRAASGVWAIEAGRIYVAPWIQSTETIVVRYVGIKRDWADGDLVDDDPELLRAVDNFVRWEHYRDWEKNPGQSQAGEMAYKVALAQLMYDCDQETKVRACQPNQARGIAPLTKLYFNDREQRATENCPANQTGDPVTVIVPKDSVGSTVSIQDANALALAQARQMARDQLDCTTTGVVSWNTAQSFTAVCGTGGSGNPSTVTIPAGQYSSTVSQADANAQALAAATAQANDELDCTYLNAEQSYTAECDADETGDDVTETIAAGDPLYTSSVSQADADAKALAAAKLAADTALVCDGTPKALFNTSQLVTLPVACLRGGALCSFTVKVSVAAGRFSSTVSIAQANAAANSAASIYANLLANQRCALMSAIGINAPCSNIVGAI